MDKHKIRDKVEDLYIKKTQRFAFLDSTKLDDRYIEWLEKRIFINKKDIGHYKQKEYAKIVGYLPQKISFFISALCGEWKLRIGGFEFPLHGGDQFGLRPGAPDKPPW